MTARSAEPEVYRLLNEMNLIAHQPLFLQVDIPLVW